MTARNRLPPWHEELRLRNGRQVLIRPIRPDDAVPLRAGFSLLQPDEVRQRFLYAMKELSPEMAHRLTHPDPRSEFALVVSEPLPPGEALIGAVARASIDGNGGRNGDGRDDSGRDNGTRDAEFAILVSRYISGMGLGRHLMRRLVRWAKGKKLDSLYGDVLEHNHPMLSLVQSLGFHREHSEVPGLVRVILGLRDTGGKDTASGVPLA